MTPEELESIRYEYMTTTLSLSQLAARHNITKSSLNRLVKKYSWDIEKKKLNAEIAKRSAERTETKLERFADAETARREAVYTATDKLLELVNYMYDMREALAPRDLQSMSSTLINIRQLYDIRPPEEDKASASINVHMTGDVSAWAE